LNSGQTCVRPDFCLVADNVADEFLAILKKTVASFYGEDAQKSEWFGRCINKKAFERLDALVKKREGHAKLVFGGKSDSSEKFLAPTCIDYGSDLKAFSKVEIMQDEIFGPILPVCRFTKFEEAVQFARTLPTGKPLALYFFSQNQSNIETIKKRTTSGGLVINDVLMHLVNHDLPFGGVGASGMGSYHGERSFNTFTHEKAVLEKSPVLDESIFMKPLLQARFPPYTPIKQKLVAIFGGPLAEKAVNFPIPMLRSKMFWIFMIIYYLWSNGYTLVKA